MAGLLPTPGVHDPGWHEGCFFCHTPVCDQCPGESPVCTVDTDRHGYVTACCDCAGVDPDEARRDLDPEYDPVPADLNACEECGGLGGVLMEYSRWAGEIYDPCSVCNGSGRRVPLGGAA